MTAVYDPADPRYFDPADLQAEVERVFDLCHGCRLCFNLCPSFPTLFDFVDGHDGEVSAMGPAERDQVVDECYQCKLCALKCPYVPPHEWALDFPRLMLRVHANRQRDGVGPARRLTDQFLGRTDLLGAVSSAAAPIVNALTGSPGSFSRKVMERTVGVAATRVLPPYARERFSTWFAKRPAPGDGDRDGATVALFASCFVEYMDPAIGRDLVGVLEHNRVSCTLPQGVRCCGAPWLHSGNVAEFERAARHNVEALAPAVAGGADVIVPQPTCAYVVKFDYPLYLGSDAAEAVAAHTADPAEYLMRRHRGDDGPLVTEFPGVEAGEVPERVTYHVPCHLQAQSIGLKSRDLLALAGVSCDLVQRCSGVDGTWGYRRDHYELARAVAAPMAKAIEAAGNDVVCGDCTLANGAITEETGRRPVHPIQLFARAYGLRDDAGPEEAR